MTSARPFFDTNVLIYAFASGDSRSETARNLLDQGGRFSVQVANEFVDVALRKLRWSWDEFGEALDLLRTRPSPPLPLSDDVHRAAVALGQRFGSRIYDAAIVAAALRAGCRTLYTEDLQHGPVVDGLTVVNPLRPA